MKLEGHRREPYQGRFENFEGDFVLGIVLEVGYSFERIDVDMVDTVVGSAVGYIGC